ncbi:MAG: 2-oxo acid dehydrogenase subunit E2 [Rhodanobacteraceae bacterium]|nr:2-oxo acid dehydrogenase subunit E2 [Rhodanobacteraceae bacterium]
MGRYVFKLPDVGEGIAESEIAEWRVKVGDVVKEDQPLVDMLTDKASVEISSPVSGKIIELCGNAGDMAAVGGPLVILEVEGAGTPGADDVVAKRAALAAGSGPAEKPGPGTRDPGPAEKPAPATPSPAPAPAPTPAPVAASPGPGSRVPGPAASIPRPPGEKPLASPAVRRRAQELGIQLQYVAGTGPAGQISHADLDAFIARGSAAPAGAAPAGRSKRDGVEAIKVIGVRRKIAEAMQRAKQRIPHFAYVEEVDVTELESLRKHLNTEHAKRGKLTLLPFLVRALANGIVKFPQVNVTYDDEAGIAYRHAALHVGIATQTPNGLVVPVVRNAEALDLWETSAEIKRLANAAREGKAKREELTGSTMTITSLGALGGIVTTPVINAPEVAIIGVNKMIERPMVRSGQIVIRSMMNLSSCFDHRMVDGYDAAEFIQFVRAQLENPATLFID